MPCYQVQTVSVEFKAVNRQLLNQAVEELGWSIIDVREGSVTVYGRRMYDNIRLDLTAGKAMVASEDQPSLNELKRAYSRAAVKLAAKMGGWRVQPQTTTKGQLVRGCM